MDIQPYSDRVLNPRLACPSGQTPSVFRNEWAPRSVWRRRGGEAVRPFLSSVFRPALVHTQPSLQRAEQRYQAGVKRPGREPRHSLAPSAEVNNNNKPHHSLAPSA